MKGEMRKAPEKEMCYQGRGKREVSWVQGGQEQKKWVEKRDAKNRE